MRPERIAARNLLAALTLGEAVVITTDGKARGVTVQRILHSADPGGFGSMESSRVTVGYGPGRWNTEVTVEALANEPAKLLRHVEYPHWPGRLYDCPACEACCHCTEAVARGEETECLWSGHESTVTFTGPGPHPAVPHQGDCACSTNPVHSVNQNGESR